MPSVTDLRVQLFADGADLDAIRQLAADPRIQGFTTNPTLMRKAGVTDYAAFAKRVLGVISSRPISFEVFSDDFSEMERQAIEIASWAPNVNVKVPVTNTRGEFAGPLIRDLAEQGVRLNVTALMTLDQVRRVAECLRPDVESFVSVFAGRIADTGVDPVPIIAEAVDIVRPLAASRIIWASPRELLNVFQADQAGCHIITATPDVLAKLKLVGKDLAEYSLDTVKMFRDDAVAAGYSIRTNSPASA
ncbi:MAG: transaldolase [Acidobacteriota bacterium]